MRVTPRSLALAAVLALAVWLPRGFALDRLVTVDEPSWLTFSGNFYRALAHGELEHTFQIGHPGVTTTWLGAAAFLWRYPAYPNDAPGQIDWTKDEIGHYLSDKGHDPLELLVAGRTLMVLALTAVLVGAGLVAARLLGAAAGVLGVGLIAADPFHIALSRVLHVDALAGSLMLLSVLGCVAYLDRRRTGYLVLSGVAAGLAWLTKAPSLFLVPFVGMLLLAEHWPLWRRQHRARAEERRTALRTLIIWGGMGLLVFVCLWPAVWVDPIRSFGSIVAQALDLARVGHVDAPLFFDGAIVAGDPGPRFYPIAFLWRTTPVVLGGLLLAAAGPATGWPTPAHRRTAAVLTAYAVLFTVFMSIGAKKFDRYLLPAHLALDVVAALGWVSAAQWIAGRFGPMARAAVPLLGTAALAGQLACALPAFPYYFSYYNPLLGGTTRAPRVMMVGWGEGLDQAADYLNRLPDADRRRVASWVWNGTFSYFYKGRIVPGREWPDADYTVLYINFRQRGRLPPELLEEVRDLTPVKVVRLQGLDYAEVYDLRAARARSVR